MKPIVFDFEFGTANRNLAIDKISRAYALLITNHKIKEYGFEYQFSKALSTSVEKQILSDRPIAEDSVISSGINATNKDTIANHISDTKLSTSDDNIGCKPLLETATNKDSIGLKQDKVNMALNIDSLGELFDISIVSDNHYSIGCISKDLAMAIANENICTIYDIITASNITLRKALIDDMKLSDNSESVGIKEFAHKVSDRYYNNISNKLKSIMLEKGTESDSYVMSDLFIYSESYPKDTIVNNNVRLMINNSNKAFIDENIILNESSDIFGFINEKHMYGHTNSKLNTVVDLKSLMFDKTQMREISYIYPNKLASRWGKFLRLDKVVLYDRTQSRQMNYLKELRFDRQGKPHSYIWDGILSYDRAGKLDTLLNTKVDFASRYGKYTDIVKGVFLYDTFDRNCYIQNSDSMADSKKEINGQIDTDVSFGDILFREVFKDTTHIKATSNERVFELDEQMALAVSPEKKSFVKIFDMFDANIIEKVVFSDRASHISMRLQDVTLDGVNTNRPAITLINPLVAQNSQSKAEISQEILEALSKDVDSVILCGFVDADNSQSQMDLYMTKITADMKSYLPTAIDLMAVGWGKKPHDTDLDIKLIDVDDNEISESIRANIMQIAEDINKKRLSLSMNNDDLGYRKNKKQPSLYQGITDNAMKDIRHGLKFNPIKSSDWDTEWEQLTKILVDSKDKYDKLKVPNDDFNYSTWIEKVYDKDTGVPFEPIGPINQKEVEVNLPVNHFNTKYNNLLREEIPVDLYVYKDLMLLIWIFWCKQRGTERTVNVLKEYYQTENVDMTRLNEYSRIVQMDAAKALNYVLDKCYDWIQQSISYHDTEKMGHYERVMKQARWFGETIAVEYSKYILVREYDPLSLDMSDGSNIPIYTDNVVFDNNRIKVVSDDDVGRLYVLGHSQAIDGEVVIECMLSGNSSLKVIIDEDEKISHTENGVFLENNPTESEFIKPAIKIDLPVGAHDVKIILEGTPGSIELLGLKFTNQVFKSAKTRYESREKTGTQAIDRLLTLMHEYYEIHHKHKAKGVRNQWLSN